MSHGRSIGPPTVHLVHHVPQQIVELLLLSDLLLTLGKLSLRVLLGNVTSS